MPIILEMPSLSPSMEKGNLISWIKNEGDIIAVGDIIAEIETDKAVMELESVHKGILVKIIVPAKSNDVSVKTPIAIIRLKDDTDEQIQDAINNLSTTKPIDPETKITQAMTEPQPQTKEFNGIKASPLAKRIANEAGIDMSKIKGTGPGQRIVKADVLNFKPQPTQSLASGTEFIDEEISMMRKVIAEKLTKSKLESPHAYLMASANVSDLLDTRARINNSGLADTKILIDAFVAKATALAMRDFPEINSSWIDGKIRKFQNIDVSVAVAIDGGVITPIIKNCDKKSVKEISLEIKELANEARDGTLKPHQFVGGGITLSNLGMFEIDSFLSIINPPQASILSIGPSKKMPICNDSGEIVVASIMKFGYAIDHRVLDGAVAAKFLCSVVKYLENPIILMAL